MFTVKIIRKGIEKLECAQEAAIVKPGAEIWPEEVGCASGQREQPSMVVSFTDARGVLCSRFLYGNDERVYIVNENGKTVASA